MDNWFLNRWSGRAVLLTVLCIACVNGQTEPDAKARGRQDRIDDLGMRFVPLDVLIDSGEANLAAYQFELEANSKQVRLVSVEGGEHAAFREPPFYDPAALQQNQVIVAAFSTAKELPSGKQRIARIHLQIDEDVKPEYTIKLITAASRDGQEISPEITVVAAQGVSP